MAMNKSKYGEFSELNALCWWSRKTGISYGRLSSTCTRAELQAIYDEYRVLCEAKMRREQELEEAYHRQLQLQNRKRPKEEPVEIEDFVYASSDPDDVEQ